MILLAESCECDGDNQFVSYTCTVCLFMKVSRCACVGASGRAHHVLGVCRYRRPSLVLGGGCKIPQETTAVTTKAS